MKAEAQSSEKSIIKTERKLSQIIKNNNNNNYLIIESQVNMKFTLLILK